MIIDPVGVADFEIVIGLVAPIGTDLDSLCNALEEQMRLYSYSAEPMRLSHLLDISKGKETADYYSRRMDAGDSLRVEANSGDAVAALAVGKMLERRGDERGVRRAWILRTLKHDHEVDLLRAIFRGRFVLIGVQQPKHKRAQYLKERLKTSKDRKKVDSAVADLIHRDEMDESTKLGQRVRETYSLADYFIDLERDVAEEAARVLGLLFGQPFLTPTRDEVAMAHAYVASRRSSDPGRQVGAVITQASGETIAIGSNEVPKSGGGEYWTGDAGDSRDFQTGVDFNKREMMRVLAELLDSLADEGHLSSNLAGLQSEARLASVFDHSKAALKSTRMLSLIEFGRIVHAEMSALMQAARSTVSVQGGTIYTTAFPCHMCMRLIIAAGIARVVYVDPYPKSLAMEMYEDSIDEDKRIVNRVSVSSFNGASWRIYDSVFEGHNRERDDYGRFIAFEKKTARFILADDDPLMRADALENEVVAALVTRTRMSEAELTTESNINSNGD